MVRDDLMMTSGRKLDMSNKGRPGVKGCRLVSKLHPRHPGGLTDTTTEAPGPQWTQNNLRGFSTEPRHLGDPEGSRIIYL